LPVEVKFCNKCGAKVEEIITTENKTKTGGKGVLASIVSFVVFILAFGTVKYLTQNGFSALSNTNTEKQQVQQATQKAVNYFTDNTNWKDFSSTLGRFSVQFPNYPSHQTQNLNAPGIQTPIKMETYSSEQDDGTTYAINFTTYPSDEVDTSVPENNLEGSVNGTVQTLEGDLINSKFVSFGNYKAIDYLIYKTDSNIYYHGKNIMVDNTIYQLIAVYETKNSQSVQFDKFVNSFKF
jgi:hypothetical protein